jgi:hypothetical protein
MKLRPVTFAVAVLALVLMPASGAQAAAPVCETPPAQTLPHGQPLYLYGGEFCSDADGDTLTFEVVASPAHGTVSGTDNFVYTPEADFAGSDSFSFKAKDASTESNTVTVDITVEPNHPPQCPMDGSVDAEPGQDTILDPYYWYDDDEDLSCRDPDFTELTFTIVDPPTHGTLSPYEPGIGFRYRPRDGYSGPDLFTFRASDGEAESGLVSVHITVLKPNHAPTCVSPLTLHVEPDRSISLGPLDRPLSCSDPDDDPLWPSLVSGPDHGSFALLGDAIVYRPDRGFLGTDTIRYRVSDPRGGVSNLATLFIVVAPAPAMPPATATPPAQAADTAAPRVRIAAAKRQTMQKLRRRGLKLIVRSSEASRVTITLSIDRGTARQLGLRSRTIGSATRTMPAGRAMMLVKLTPKARKALRHAHQLRLRVTVKATDAAGNHRTRMIRVTVRR